MNSIWQKACCISCCMCCILGFLNRNYISIIGNLKTLKNPVFIRFSGNAYKYWVCQNYLSTGPIPVSSLIKSSKTGLFLFSCCISCCILIEKQCFFLLKHHPQQRLPHLTLCSNFAIRITVSQNTALVSIYSHCELVPGNLIDLS